MSPSGDSTRESRRVGDAFAQKHAIRIGQNATLLTGTASLTGAPSRNSTGIQEQDASPVRVSPAGGWRRPRIEGASLLRMGSGGETSETRTKSHKRERRQGPVTPARQVGPIRGLQRPPGRRRPGSRARLLPPFFPSLEVFRLRLRLDFSWACPPGETCSSKPDSSPARSGENPGEATCLVLSAIDRRRTRRSASSFSTCPRSREQRPETRRDLRGGRWARRATARVNGRGGTATWRGGGGGRR